MNIKIHVDPPRKKGKWIVQGEHDYDGKHYYDVLCSRCRMSYQIADYRFNNREIRYCVKCGAKMEGTE
jgi:PHP family Zn ribbon phosphoesterase